MTVLVRNRRIAALAATAMLLACRTPAWQTVPHDRLFQRTPAASPHPAPEKTEALDSWYAIDHAAVRPLAVAVNPGHYVERIVGGPPPLDVNHFGQVIDSSWFTNRISRYDLSPEQARIGPNRSGGPAPGPFLVISGKAEGATPGLVIRDSAGVEFIVKFDPPAFPSLSSGAEIIATKILWAAGYHVPENYVLSFDLKRLVLEPGATTRDKHGSKVKLTPKALKDLIALVNPYPDGSIRALFSKHLPGRLLGPFTYRGQRADDPHDNLPHERRRSLRGLWLFSAWINNTDTRRANTMDVFIPTRPGADVGLVRHYLLDFGDALGAAGTKPKFPGLGYESRLDWWLIARSFFSAGLAYRYWLPIQRSPFRSVGLYESQVFEPERWRPSLPNPAFDDADRLDTYWAGSVIARFGPEQLKAIVESAQYTEPGAQEWVLRVLLGRQYRVLKHAFATTLALDTPTTRGWTLSMIDLEVQANLLLAPDAVRYRWQAEDLDGRLLDEGEASQPMANLKAAVRKLRATKGATRPPFLTVRWWRVDGETDLRPVVVRLRVLDEQVIAVALERP